ncbi:YdcH family protein [Maliponia aquimaris]|uniref:DUF465 domain-containing protein n=1 Tax=Maliponia aquimaris TaxID=1673631 RepID=A0A238K3L4_9RHOB|nr:YdcH family protein [Maliponia aquimaris]SMX36692.1 hypothetical protein MAA8898_00985 [Maliponia aquimaris]
MTTTRMTKGNSASVQARIAALRTRHADLEAQIDNEHGRPLPSAGRLRALKARKLMLKDEMAYYDGVLRTLANLDSDSSRGAA